MPVHDYTAACFNCRYPLDGLDSTACPECGRPFDLDDAATFNRVLSDPVKITERLIESAVLLRMHLEHEGVPTAQIELSGGIVMYAPIPMASLHVNRRDEDIARELMAEHDAGQSEDVDVDWTCPNCSEQIEGQFNTCWNCGQERSTEHNTSD